MKKLFGLVRHDFHKATSNVISIIVLFGVVAIPSFFAWFNVLSSWNPFDNVKNLKIAVASVDEGYLSDLFPMKISVGEQVLSSLRANDDVNWVFVSEEDAIEGTKSEEYYAAIVLPRDFSQQMMTFLSPDAEPAQIDFYINEKKNALSPMITGEAATDVSVQINETFTKTLNEVGLALVSTLATHLEDSEAQQTLERLESRVGQVAVQLDAAATTAEAFGALVSSSKTLVLSAGSLTESASDAVKDTSGSIATGATAVSSLRGVLQSATQKISEAFAASAERYEVLAREVDQFYLDVQAQSQQAEDKLTQLSAEVQDHIVAYSELRDVLRSEAQDPALDAPTRDALNLLADQLDNVVYRLQALAQLLDQAAADLHAGIVDVDGVRDAILAEVDAAKAAVDAAQNQYANVLRPKLDRLANSLDSVMSSFGVIVQDLSAADQALRSGSGSLLSGLTIAEGAVATLVNDLRSISTRFGTLQIALEQAAASGDLSEVSRLIGSDPAVFASELTSPVTLKTVPVFKVDNFGSQMAPLYSVLGLWVGALLLAVLIRTGVTQSTLPLALRPLTPAQEYFGRFAIFATLALLQSSLLFIGLIAFVGVEPAHPMLLILAGWVMSFVFSMITYTLVLSFGEAGKALAVLLLVVQISAGGGAYPLSVLPQWFQNISPFIPVSHATTAVRAAIAGIYEADYWIALGWLLVFTVPTLLIGLVLRLPMRKFNDNLNDALESTKLIM